MVKFVRIDTFQKVKDFVNLMQDIKEDTVLRSERYSVDAKSIMGVLSLDLDKTLMLVIDGIEDETIKKEISYFEVWHE